MRPLVVHYHDTEWGVPEHDDSKLFEALTLRTFQAGHSWDTLLRHRPQYRKAFADFDPQRLAAYEVRDIARVLQHPDIIRNRVKIEAAISNARQAVKIQDEFGSFGNYVWHFVDHSPIEHRFKDISDYPARDGQSDRISADLRKHGFLLAITGVCYAFMEAVGMVNDHTVPCFRHAEVAKLK